MKSEYIVYRIKEYSIQINEIMIQSQHTHTHMHTMNTKDHINILV